MINLGFSGSRRGMSSLQKQAFQKVVNDLQVAKGIGKFHHGDCVGADAEAHAFVRNRGIFIIVHPPENATNRAYCVGNEVRPSYDYSTRNRHIVEETDRLIATPLMTEHEQRQSGFGSGTWHAVNFARRCGKQVMVLLPDGRSQTWNWQL